MTSILVWISLALVSISLIYLFRWVKEGAQVYALIGLVFVEITLIIVLNVLK